MKLLIAILILFCSCAKSQPSNITINGIGTSVTINSGQAGSPITVNYTEYFPSQTGDITFTDADFQYSIAGYAKTNFTARSPAGFVEFRTSETAIDVKVAGNNTPNSSLADCEVLVDGVYNQSLRVINDNVVETKSITLPAGEKIVTLINGYTNAATSGNITIANEGVFIQGVVTTGTIEVKKPTVPANKWLFVGNSITAGNAATHPSATGFAALFRNDGRSLQVDAFGSRTLATTTTNLANQMASFVSAEMDGSLTNTIFIFLGTNNFAFNQSKATFKTYYGLFLDAIRAIRTDIDIYCVSPLNRTTYSTPNSGGATCEDYSDAIQELLVTRTWAKFIYGKTLVSISNISGDGVHPTQTGMQEIHDNLLTAYNDLQ